MGHADVWFVLPTANAENCRKTFPAWRDLGYRIAVLQDRARFACDADRIVHVDRYPGWPATVNRLFREVVPADVPVIVSGGDDMYPDPRHHASDLRDQFLDHFAGTFGVMQPHGDDFEDTSMFCGSPWLGRRWMERMYGGTGGMHAGYTHHFADDELYWVSRCLDALWTRADLTQYHEHFRRSASPPPDYWLESVWANDERDALLYLARARHGFPGHEPVGLDRRFDHDRFRAEYTGRAEAHWKLHYGHGIGDTDAVARMAAALRDCAERGFERVAIFPAGRHTRRIGDALFAPPVEIAMLIDDDPGQRGRTQWNFPVRSRVEALIAGGIDAVVLSSDSIEATLWDAAAVFREAGIPVVRLYGEPVAATGIRAVCR